MTTTHKYMSYDMSPDGLVTRNHVTILLSDVRDYSLRDDLRGWPEKEVYWQVLGDYSRIGIAPLSAAAKDAMLKQGGFVSINK